jgi:CRP/FNR family cyclic AMP-dependent transcriptional regulator
MKRLLGRFSMGRGIGLAEAEPPAADDEGYFATQVMEPPVAGEPHAETFYGNGNGNGSGDEGQGGLGDLHPSAWTARARSVGAQALDPETGLALLRKAWGTDALMATLPESEHRKLIAHLDFVTVPPGQELIAQNERGDYALVVLEGLVAVDRLQPTGARARLAEAREGDVLGEMSLLDAGARFASCATLSRCSLAVIAHSALDELAVEEPRLGMAVMASVARRLSLRMRQLSARLGALLAAG